jgi:hypothetical protein
MRGKIKDLLVDLGTRTDTVIYNAIAVDSKGQKWRLNVTLGVRPLTSKVGTETWPEIEITQEIDQYLLSWKPSHYVAQVFPRIKSDQLDNQGFGEIMWSEYKPE